MIKGVNRSVIMVKTDKDSRFESAYFVLRPHMYEGKGSGGAILEARDILRAGEIAGRGKRRFRRFVWSIMWFVLGVLVGVGGAWLVYAVFL